MKLIMYIILPIALIISCLSLIIFSDDVYRYPCQNPENWNTVECEPPQCEAMGLCTKYLIELPPDNTSSLFQEVPITSENQNEK